MTGFGPDDFFGPRMTCVFDFDVREYRGNPHQVMTPFGQPRIIEAADACARHAALEKEVKRLRNFVHAAIGWLTLDDDREALNALHEALGENETDHKAGSKC